MKQKRRGEYLQKQRRFGEVSVGVALVVLVGTGIIGLVLLVYVYTLVGASPLFVALTLLALIGLGWMVVQVGPSLLRSRRFTRRYESGISGEDATWRTLFTLPSGYTAFANVLLPGARGDIDFVVTGPSGVYAIDAKNYRGRITVQRGSLLRDGQPINHLVSQVLTEATSLGAFLGRVGKSRPYVTAVLAFTHPESSLEFQGKFGSAWVLPLDRIVSFISEGRQRLDARSVEQMNNLIKLIIHH
jgi:hypothetical protein